jgi:SAM-dependent methyltransferase
MAHILRALSAWDPREVVREALDTFRRIGFRATLEAASSRLRDYAFDVRYGTDTVERVPLSQLDISYDSVRKGNRYQPTGAGAFKAIMQALTLPPGEVFVDFGSGKGQVLMLAARYPFKRIVGIEFSEKLCAIAKANIQKFKTRETVAAAIDIVADDVMRYTFRDDETVFYFFIPFDDEIFMRVLENLEHSLERKPRQAWLVYYVCDEQRRAAIERNSSFVLKNTVRAGGYDCTIFCRPAGKP